MWHSEETVKNLERHLSVSVLLLLFILLVTELYIEILITQPFLFSEEEEEMEAESEEEEPMEEEEQEEEEEDSEEEEEENEDVCAECRQDGKLILCDVCPRSYHMHCARPALKKVPKGKWMCQVCVGGGRAGKIHFGRPKGAKAKEPAGKKGNLHIFLVCISHER